MKPATRLVLLVLLLLPGPAGAQDPPPGDAKAGQTEQKYEKALTALRDEDSIARSRAVETLRRLRIPKAVTPLLRMAVTEPMAYIARLAGEAAFRLDAEKAWAVLLDLVRERKGQGAPVRRNLVILLREAGTPEAGKLLLYRFKGSPDPRVQVEVLRAIGHLKLEDGVGYVKAALAARNIDVRNAAAVAAGRLGSVDLVPALLAALDNSDGFHGKFAAWALGRIDDPSVFNKVQARLGSASGESGEARAKALEATARAENVDRLVAILTASRSREYREAAAIALGRLGVKKPEVQDSLFARMMRDPHRLVRGACWHALSRVGGERLVTPLKKRAGQRDPELAKYVFHLAGDLRVHSLSPLLLKVMINERRNDMLRYAAAINFWKAADAGQVEAFERRLLKSRGRFLQRGIEALGFRRNPRGFRFLLKMLRVLRDGSPEEYLVEKSLERITGHFFGPDPGIWKKWFEKNPKFFTPKQYELERNKWREDFDKENKGFRQTEETEYAVQLGLEFLARHQHPDGRFDPQKFTELDTERVSSGAEGARFQLDPSGTTALAVLAFLGAGYSPAEGKYKDVIQRALDYLEARQQANGDFLTNDLVGGYDRPLGVQAFAEAYMLTRNPRYAWCAQRGIDLLTTIQNQLGGWRYRIPIQTTDTSCMSWNLFALKSGEKAGLEVREIAFAGCYHVMDLYSDAVKDQREDFIDIDPNYGYEVGRGTDYTFQTGYQNPVWDTKYATVPLGIMCRIFLGWRRSHPFCIGSANKVLRDMMEEIPRNEDWSLYRSAREYPTYAWYYGTLAMHQMGGRYFRLWNQRIKKVIPGTQTKKGPMRGSWPVWNHDTVAGRMYTAAMGVLTLETYYRYLPVLQD